MRQLSVESVPLFDMFQTLFKSSGSAAKLKEAAMAAGVSESDWSGFMQYVLNFYGSILVSNLHSSSPNLTPGLAFV
jgi:hypothetical protein